MNIESIINIMSELSPIIIEVLKGLGSWIIYPLVGAYVALKIARFHFEKDIRTQYLLAKDKIANQILELICYQLSQMWEVFNLKNWEEWYKSQNKEDELKERKNKAYEEFYSKIHEAFPVLGKMGLYYGTDIVDKVSELQTEWNEMMNKEDMSKFEDWSQYRRERLLPLKNIRL
jgi:hypothetical protein